MCMQIPDGVTRPPWKLPAAVSWQGHRTPAAAGPAQGSPQPAAPYRMPSSGTLVHRDAGHCLHFKVQGSKGSGKPSLITAFEPTFKFSSRIKPVSTRCMHRIGIVCSQEQSTPCKMYDIHVQILYQGMYVGEILYHTDYPQK